MNDESNMFSEYSLDDIFKKFNQSEKIRKKPQKPFKFLDSYTMHDRDIFFGRDNETEEIYRRFYSSNLLLVYGKSGSGKTSVVNCGLLTKIPSQDIYPIYIRCGKNPVENLFSEIKKHCHLNSDDIVKMIDDIFLENYKPVTLFFDQFEELFIFSEEAERKKLKEQISKILDSYRRTNIVIILREEYLASLSEFESDIPKIFSNRVRIEKMNRSLVKSVIEQPLKLYNIDFEQGISEVIINLLSNQSHEIELTYLQILLDKLIHKASAENPDKPLIRKKHLMNMKDVGNILNHFLDEQINLLANSNDAEVVVKAMVSSEGTKEPLTLKEISDRVRETGIGISVDSILAILQHFIKLRIISDKDDKGQYELKHDSLAKSVFQRMSLFEKEFMEARRLVNNRYNDYLKHKSLLDEKSLTFISAYEKHMVFSKEIEDFILKSKQHLQLQIEEEQKYHDTLASINYANQMISAFLPSVQLFKENLKEYFIFNQPKQIVSGDFYFVKRIGSKLYIAVADSTGAGIPAAFLSILGLSLLNEIINNDKLDSNEILNQLRKRVIVLLRQEAEKRTGSGFDMGLCVIDLEKNLMQYSGACIPLYIVRNGEYSKIKPQRISIGYNPFYEGDVYEKQEIKIVTGDKFYMVTDGFVGQYNGNTFEAYKTKYLHEFLEKMFEFPMSQQKELFANEFNNWKGNYEQMDDVLAVGFSI